MTKKSLAEYKGKFDSFGQLCTKSDLADKEVEVLEDHVSFGILIEKGERGIIVVPSESSGYAKFMKEELPVYFPRWKDNKEICLLPVPYEKLALIHDGEVL